ncbi:zinc finger protein 462-like isoform X2 [Sphaeramia orbicularis]|uniref:zinc finger protein 462-like isoform X2 n=1 Tax=Sphaeramia orbicularis TaxID=375764 RepID=UPI00117D8035|nr:zinc finger protein 462-like isoform X2 [Sphaeramia orbicularis]
MMQNQTATQESPVQTFQCSQCVLIFKSRPYLFDHLTKVHGSDVDSALKYTGLKGTGTPYSCQDCNFKHSDWTFFTEHKKECPKSNQLKEDGKAKGVSHTKTKCTVISTKNLKIYKKPSQTITKYFAPLSGSNVKFLEDNPASVDNSKGTLILEESSSNSKPHSSGVFTVTAKSIDIDTRGTSNQFLLNDQLFSADVTHPKPVEQIVTPNPGKRTIKESFTSCPAKQAKIEKVAIKVPETTIKNLTFEVSEDEMEVKGDLVNRDAEGSTSHFCKHCDYSDADIKRMCTHYMNNHPYIRYNWDYIKEPSDHSATFRCLECPVEFLCVTDLTKHYAKDHPEAQNVLTMKTCDLKLVFKCFVCLFTFGALKMLKKHHEEMHPTYKVENPLMYCRYSSARRSAELSSPEKYSPKRSVGISTPAPGKEDKNTSLTQHPTPREADNIMYQCNNCTFSHKSVVVLHVHYKKTHPDEEITLDKIKQSVCVASPTSGQLRPVDTVALKDKCTPPKDIMRFFSESKNKPESPQKKISSSPVNPKQPQVASKANSEFPKSNRVECVEGKTRVRKSLLEHNQKMLTDTDLISSSSQNMFHCNICDYSNVSVKRVINHCNTKHTGYAGHTVKNMVDICQYSGDVQSDKHQSEAEANYQKELYCEGSNRPEKSMTKSNPYACALDLFYCQVCNYGNLTVQGILNHQNKVHSNLHGVRENVIKHTALIRDEIKKSKSQPKDPFFSSGLPLPIIKDSDKDLCFCHFCNYRHHDTSRVRQHYFKVHRGFKITSKQIRLHSTDVLEKVQKTYHGRKGNQKKTSKKSLRSFPFSTSVSKTQRTLQCPNCAYATQHVYLLRRHLYKIHKTKYSAGDVLNLCCQQGSLQPGYHCDMCVFSSKEPVQLQEHFGEKHFKLNRSLEYIFQLYVDPKMCSSKKKNLKTKQNDGQHDSDDPGSSLQFQRSAQKDCKIYSCRACSFRGTSVSSITSHYRAIHPWSVKEDGSVLDVICSKEQTANMQLEDSDEYYKFETYQVPLEFDNSPASSHEETGVFQCSHCSASFHSQHGLIVHCGMKHPQSSEEIVNEQQVENNTRVHIFKCLHCAYVNTRYQGVLTHIQMKHPGLEAKADSLYVDNVHLNNAKMTAPDDMLRFSGYRCKKCSHIFSSQDMLDKHNEKNHKKMPLKIKLKLTPKPLVVNDRPPSHSTQELVLNAASDVQHNEYKCVLCPCSFITATRLGIHYTKKHGKETFLKYYAPMYGQKPKKPALSSPNHSQTQELEHTSGVSSTVEECAKKLMYKCLRCSYLNASCHGTLTHLQMKHPGVVAKGEKLRKVEILASDLVGCNLGKGDNERGYQCKKCPQIHPSVKKLKLHREREHKHGAPVTSEHSAETEQPALSKDHSSVLGSGLSKKKKSALAKSSNFMYSCSLCTYSTLIRKQLGTHYTQRHGKSAFFNFFMPVYYPIHKNINLVHGVKDNPENTPETTTPAIQDAQYKCHMCSYKAVRRRYLHSHYRKKHKLDLHTVCKLLQKYDRYRGKKKLEDESENGAQVECKECPKLFFKSPKQLIAHYSTFHRSQYILDFTVLAQRSQKNTGVFRCDHCQKKINGIRNLHLHLDRHRARKNKKANAAKMTAATVTTVVPEAASVKLTMQEKLPTLETVEEFVQRNLKPLETSTVESTLPASPPSLCLTATELEQPEVETSDDKNTCKLCKRSFMSLKGLRSHERSHAALAAIKKLDNLSTSAKHEIENYLIYKSGTQRPFMCSICSYRTTVMGLWKSHLIKKHIDAIEGSSNTSIQDEENTQSYNEDPPDVSEEINLPESDEETKDALYSEPPDVQRQLNHYHLMAQIGSSSKASLQEAQLPETAPLNCELCNFNSEHLSSMRRHYLHRHGKKIIRCKDCNFFTSLRKNLEMHMETGHSTFQSGPTHQKDLRCPFCLYQSKNKNNMIDHIILHREERVMPIQVRRPKLSRYLQGIVFRCHKCTFTSASAENLRLHMMRHDDIKPFRCRLCYFDCSRLNDLEAHLCDKHQVVRNHELVGQVSLDMLSAQISRPPEEEEEEELLCNLETDTEFVTACNELQKGTEEKNIVQIEHSYCEKESYSESCVLKLQHEDDAKQITAVKEMPERAAIRGITHTKKTEGIQIAECEDLSDPMKDMQMNEDQDQPKLRGSEDDAVQPKDEAADKSSSNHGELDEKNKMHIKTLQDGSQSIEAKMEDDVLHDIFLLDNGGSGLKVEKKAVVEDNGLNLDKTSVTLTLKSFIVPACSSMQLINHYMQPDKGSSGVSVTNSDKEQTQSQANGDKLMDAYGEMPVLENEYLKEEMPHLHHFTEISHSDRVEDTDDDLLSDDAENGCTDQQNGGEDGVKEEENKSVPEGDFADTKAQVKALCSPSTEEKLFTCELCGRSLDNRSELERHVLRHGM